MPLLARGQLGAVSAAHPLAAAAGAQLLRQGGNAIDAALGAQAVICVLMPQAASLGGDVLALVRRPDTTTIAVNGTGTSAADARAGHAATAGESVTTPGLVAGWASLHKPAGRLGLAEVMQPAIELARTGVLVDDRLAEAVQAQRARLLDGGAGAWDLLEQRPGDVWRQAALAETLTALAAGGGANFYTGFMAEAVSAAIRRHGGQLNEKDLGRHTTDVRAPVTVDWDGARVHVQPPMSQGVLLGMALQHLEDAGLSLLQMDRAALEHVLVELTEAAFTHRSDCAEGEALLAEPLLIDLERAGRRGGPRGYLHTAGVATADANGLVVSSLVSVFDDFGSGIFVPELGCTLNNRAAGFTDGANALGPGKKPVHTLAPALAEGMKLKGRGVLAVATPGADGQVQTLLQILVALRSGSSSLPEAVAALRWRSESGALLVEEGHPAGLALIERGHRVQLRPAGDPVFGAVVAAGIDDEGPFCVSDWRRQTSSAAV